VLPLMAVIDPMKRAAACPFEATAELIAIVIVSAKLRASAK
jgi:hypothetical protein